MHLIRLLLQGVSVLQTGELPVAVTEHRDVLLAIRDGQQSWDEVNRWRLSLHADFDRTLQATKLPDAPDYAAATQLLISARRQMVDAT